MIGIRAGIAAGIRAGIATGASEDPIAPTAATGIPGVTRDATSMIYAPASAAEWTLFNAYWVGQGLANFPNIAPSIIWTCQDASGNLADTSGNGLTGTVTGAPITYQQAVAGWSRVGIVGADTGTAIAESVAAGVPDPATVSRLDLGYAICTATPTAIRNLHTLGTGTPSANQISTTPRFRGTSGTTVTGTVDPRGAVRPYSLLYDVTGNRFASASDQEILAPTRALSTGKRARISFTFTGAWLYQISFFAAAAEISNAQLKALKQALGFTILW